MKQDAIYVEQLMMEKLSGIIDGESAAYLDELIQKDERVRGQWERFVRDYDKMGGARFGSGFGSTAALSRLREGMDKPGGAAVRSLLVKRLMAAASLAIPVVVVGVLLLHRSRPVPAASAKTGEKKVKLYLGGGREIDLSAGGQTDVKDVKLHVGNGSLSYTTLKGGEDQELNTLVVPATMTYDLTLSDGVEVWLNSESRLKFPFSFGKDKREVWVSGEAYFKVPPEAHRPFVVHTSVFDVQVLGTEFNVNTYDSLRTTAALVSGAINARTAEGAAVLIKPGYSASYSGGNTFQLKRFDSEDLSWIKGLYYFDHASLQDIAAAVRRWYGAELVFDEPGIAGLRFTGAMIRNKPLKEFLDNLEMTSGIKYTADGGVIHLHIAGRS